MAWQEEGEDVRQSSRARMGRVAVSTATVQDPAGGGGTVHQNTRRVF